MDRRGKGPIQKGKRLLTSPSPIIEFRARSIRRDCGGRETLPSISRDSRR